jgi:hypothetical protein
LAQRLEKDEQVIPQNRLVNARGVGLFFGGPAFPAIKKGMGVAPQGAADFDVPFGPQRLRVDSHENSPRPVASFV